MASGGTPLMRAAKAGELGIMQALLEPGADPCLKDKAGRDAWEAAREVGN